MHVSWGVYSQCFDGGGKVAHIDSRHVCNGREMLCVINAAQHWQLELEQQTDRQAKTPLLTPYSAKPRFYRKLQASQMHHHVGL